MEDQIKETIKIDIDWGWKEEMQELITKLEWGSEDEREYARKELMDLADILDRRTCTINIT